MYLNLLFLSLPSTSYYFYLTHLTLDTAPTFPATHLFLAQLPFLFQLICCSLLSPTTVQSGSGTPQDTSIPTQTSLSHGTDTHYFNLLLVTVSVSLDKKAKKVFYAFLFWAQNCYLTAECMVINTQQTITYWISSHA